MKDNHLLVSEPPHQDIKRASFINKEIMHVQQLANNGKAQIKTLLA